MKKAIALVLCLVMACIGAVSALAVFNTGDTSATPKDMSIQMISGTWAPDGVINDGSEYYDFTPPKSDMSYNENNSDSSNTDTALAEAVQFKSYASYDNNYLYLAFDVDISTMPNGFFQDQDPGNMWQDACIQVSLATMDQADPSNAPQTDRTEYGFGLTSTDNTQMFTSWNESSEQTAAYDPVAGTDYCVVKNGNDLIYEVRLPWSCFSSKNYTTGDTIALNWLVGAGDQSNPNGNGTLIHIQFSQGCSETKDATLYAQCALVPAPAPATTAAPDTTAAAPAPDTTAAAPAPTSPTTGDNGVLFAVIAMVGALVLGGIFVVARKARD